MIRTLSRILLDDIVKVDPRKNAFDLLFDSVVVLMHFLIMRYYSSLSSNPAHLVDAAAVAKFLYTIHKVDIVRSIVNRNPLRPYDIQFWGSCGYG